MQSHSLCPHCGAPAGTDYHALTGEGPLCAGCARIDILGWLADCDADQLRKLRRRAEDCLRKNPGQLREALVNIIITGAIDYEDCI